MAITEGLLSFKVIGATPLLTHNPAGMKGQGTPGHKHIPTPEDEAEQGTYRLLDGSLGLPAVAIRSSLLAGMKGLRMGKWGLATVLSHIEVRPLNDEYGPEFLSLTDPESGKALKDYEIDVRRAVLGSGRTSVAVLRARPKIFPWATEFTVVYDPQVLTNEADKTLRMVIERAGAVAGVGDYRPERKGWFGRYALEE